MDLHQKVAELERRKQEIFDTNRANLDKAEAEKRDLTAEEQAFFDATTEEVKRIQDELPRLRGLLEPGPDGRQYSGPAFQDKDGRIIRALGPRERLAGDSAGAPGVGEVIRALLLNDPAKLPVEVRGSLALGSDSAGGYMVSPVLSQQFVDLARSASVVSQAGAITLPMESSELALVKLVDDFTATWRQELQALQSTNATFGRIYLRPKMLAALVPVSIELLEDAANAADMIENAIRAALASALDKAALAGTGSGEPLGVVNDGNVNTQTSVGTPSTYAEATEGVRQILAANYQGEISGLSWINHPSVWAIYDGLVTGISNDNSPLEATPWARELMRFTTTNLSPTGANYNSVIGDFSQMVIGARTSGFRVEILPAGSASDGTDTWNATSQFLRWVRVYGRFDVALLRPTFFSVMSGVTIT